MRALIFCFGIIVSLTALAEKAKMEVIEGCEGEGCECASDSTAIKDFSLYSELDKKSKVLGKFKSGTEATVVKSLMKIKNPGKARVLKVSKQSLGLKMGDEITNRTYLGEGFYKVKLKDTWIELQEADIQFKEIEKMEYEQWREIKVGKLKGYSDVFPMPFCLE